MSAPTFYQHAMATVKEFLVDTGLDERDPRIGQLQIRVNRLVHDAHMMGRAGESLNEARRVRS